MQYQETGKAGERGLKEILCSTHVFILCSHDGVLLFSQGEIESLSKFPLPQPIKLLLSLLFSELILRSSLDFIEVAVVRPKTDSCVLQAFRCTERLSLCLAVYLGSTQ